MSSTRLAASPRVGSSTLSSSWYVPPPMPENIPFPSLYTTFTNPKFPLLFALAYLIVTKTLSIKSDGKNRIQGKFWDVVVILHNVILAVYSGWTFISATPLMAGVFYKGFQEHGLAGLKHAFCDSDAKVWQKTVFPSLCYIFYLSKFYEILDTLIILAKGKRVGTLQSYHHFGAIITMFMGFASQAIPIWIFVVFNSGIHTLMYSYYTFSALKLPFPVFLKKNLTRLQITQFLVGGSLAASYLFITLPEITFNSVLPNGTPDLISKFEQAARGVSRQGGECLVDHKQRVATWANVIYLIPLTVLFARFFIKSYQKGAKGRADAAAKRAAGGKAAKIN